MTHDRPRRLRGLLPGVPAVALVAALGACTGTAPPEPDQAASSAAPSRAVETPPTLEPRPVPMQVRVAKVVGGRLSPGQRRRLESQASQTLSDYFDAAFLAGRYPRADFSRAWRAFSAGAAQRAASDRGLLTNAEIGRTTQAVVARDRSARLDALVPRRRPAALTARFRLVFLAERIERPDQRVTVRGRLLMDRRRSGRWQIFGYDVTRSARPVGKGGKR